MKKLLIPIIAIAIFLCVYLLFAFINGDLLPFHWEEGWRIAMAFLVLLGWFFVLMGTIINSGDERK